MEPKKWYTSKTLWVNALAVVGLAVQNFTGEDIVNVQAQAAILGVINLVLRLLTKTAIA